MARTSVRYRGFRIRPFIRLTPIRIGSTRLYTLGPLALFVGPKTDTSALTCKSCGHATPFRGSKLDQAERAYAHWEAVHEPNDSETGAQQ